MRLRLSAGLLVVLGLNSSPLFAQSVDCKTSPCAYMDSGLAAEVRARDLVGRMTLEEKVSQTMDRAVAIPRLGIPEYNWWNEGLHGVARNGFATVFPQAIGLAATWDPALIERVGDVIATEARAKHNVAVKANHYNRYTGLTYWSPNINIFRDPRWGRGQETYGEDPYLTATTGVAFIRGLQGDDPHYYKVVATPKHFAVHSGPEPGRHGFDVHPSAFDLEDTYLPAFRAAIVEGKADSIMCAYNAVDGAPACASEMLLQERLRGLWRFKGFVVSDCDAVGDVTTGHHFTADAAHASAVSLVAGTDLDCGSAYAALKTAVEQKLLTVAQLDTAVERLFTARFRLGMFDDAAKVGFNSLGEKDINTAQQRAIALEAARESIVLLTNKKGMLPLTGQKRIAVVGPTAELIQANEGNYNGTSINPVLPVDGIRRQFGSERVSYSPGSILAEGMYTPVPSTAFTGGDGKRAEGLAADYFAGVSMAGPARLKRVDPVLNFDWDGAPPAVGMANRFSVLWTGNLFFPAAGRYQLHFRGVPRPRKTVDVTGEGGGAQVGADKTVRLYLDDKLVIDSGTGHAEAEFVATERGAHALRIEYIRNNNERMVSLEWIPPAGALVADAVAQAAAADVVVAFVGLSPDLEGEQMSVHVPGFDGGDRTNLALPAPQQEMLQALKKTGKPLVVVMTSGSAIAANWAAENADALLEAWYGGEDAGTAIAETLAGVNNPSGKLPVTFYRDTADLPAFTDYSMKNRTYRYFQGAPLFPFGFGLSYTMFEFGKISLVKSSIKAGDGAQLNVTVRNAGARDGDEVIEIYVKAPGERAGAHQALAAFKRVPLKAGESKTVAIEVKPRQLSRVDESGIRKVRAGTYVVYAGGGQPAVGRGVTSQLVVEGSLELPK